MDIFYYFLSLKDLDLIRNQFEKIEMLNMYSNIAKIFQSVVMLIHKTNLPFRYKHFSIYFVNQKTNFEINS